jgi:pyruvate/2-oxoglutarate/acetoin dehydrogenase E1 component/TPP-dependent pyruvate/acetoin dehydrogenase alpha subunit
LKFELILYKPDDWDMLDSPISDILLSYETEEDHLYKKEVLNDYWVCCVSREVSILGRREVLTGKAKFGIVGDGKEVPQVAMARAFRKGDWRSGYYRDQTFMFALGLSTVEDFFAQLYADTERDPWSGGRQMNSHYSSPLIDEEGNWLDQTKIYNIAADVSCTGGQMARAVGLSLASKMYRTRQFDEGADLFSMQGNEICFATIGDASTSEGIFWESINAAGVQKIPMILSVWDDGYGISVPVEYQTTKASISKVLEGFSTDENGTGVDIYTEKCWNYPGLCELYDRAANKVRETHIPALIHVQDCTQQLGHSSSGSHERYKNEQRLKWEEDFDCIKVMADWIVDSGIAKSEEIEILRARAREYVKECKQRAWKYYTDPLKKEKEFIGSLYKRLPQSVNFQEIADLYGQFKSMVNPLYSELVKNARQLKVLLSNQNTPIKEELDAFLSKASNIAHKRYHTQLHSSTRFSALNVPIIPPVYSENSPVRNGYEVLNTFFDIAFSKYPNLVAFGEDIGKIGGVNQTYMGLQEKHGEGRIFDTGIREWTIIGQAIGLAMRGFKPIAEIQYLDYMIYGLEPLTDDLATLRYRSNGLQQAPAIISTRGHRLEGIWHSGSPIGMLLHSLRGIYILTPRNFVQAAGMYNTMLLSDDPALIIECLNGYRLKEKLPDNIGEYTVALGTPEILMEGTDITLVTYGSCVRVAQEAIGLLKFKGISVELIDVQTLLPFDIEHSISKSLAKTNRVLFLDEDVPGGASAFMMREVLEVQNGYKYLDSAPRTLTASAHRPPYGTDGDYFSKPNAEDVYDTIMEILAEAEPGRF